MQVIHESVVVKAKNFIANNKGKLAALAGLAAVGGAGAYAYNKGYFADAFKNLAEKSGGLSTQQYKTQMTLDKQTIDQTTKHMEKLQKEHPELFKNVKIPSYNQDQDTHWYSNILNKAENLWHSFTNR